MDFDWVAEDRNGLVAMIMSAGYGPMPREVIDHSRAIDAAINDLTALPVHGAAQSVTDMRYVGDRVAAWAARGLFVFE